MEVIHAKHTGNKPSGSPEQRIIETTYPYAWWCLPLIFKNSKHKFGSSNSNLRDLMGKSTNLNTKM